MTALMEVRVDPPSAAPSQTLSTRMAHNLPRAMPRYDADDLCAAILAARQELVADGRRADGGGGGDA